MGGKICGLKFCCDYMENFSPGGMWAGKFAESVLPPVFFLHNQEFSSLGTTKNVRMPKFIFQPGLKFECDYIRFFSPFDWAEIWPARMEISAQAETLFMQLQIFIKICSGSRAEISARLTGLKVAMQSALSFATTLRHDSYTMFIS